MRGAVVERREAFGFELREREKGLGCWLDGEVVAGVESADGMAVGGALGLLLLDFGHHVEAVIVVGGVFPP